jgi:predicted metal-dependent hydrolase
MSREDASLEASTDREAWGSSEEFKERVRDWATRIGVTPSRIRIQKATRKWGSCSPGGALTFSSELLTKSRLMGEAVIVHEVVHLRVPNHGPLFRSIAEAYLPGASDLGRWLEQGRWD